MNQNGDRKQVGGQRCRTFVQASMYSQNHVTSPGKYRTRLQKKKKKNGVAGGPIEEPMYSRDAIVRRRTAPQPLTCEPKLCPTS